MRKFLPLLILATILAVPGLAQADWSDNFDSYAEGSGLHGQGGWHGWDGNAGADAYVSAAQSLSAPHSASVTGASDIVQQYSGYTADVWAYTAWMYIPTDFAGISYFILLNTYSDGGPYNWSTQIQFNGNTDTVIFDPDGDSLPLITGQWVELRLQIDLVQDLQTVYYGGQLLIEKSWTDGNSGDGAVNIAAVDLYANNASPVYYDDMSLAQVILPEGACCDLAGNCTLTTEAECAAPSSWQGADTDCDPNPCAPPTGACCDHATGNCTITTADACAFDWLGADVPCNVQTCAPPVPTERTTWGQIKNLYH